MALSKKRQKEIMRLVYEGEDELSAAMDRGEKETQLYLRVIRKEISDFLANCEDKTELDFFAMNWNRDGNEKPIHQLIKNPYVDAGTLLRLYWQSCPEDYYLFYRVAADVDEGFERDVFQTLRRIEARMLKSDYKTSSVTFDPTSHISMSDQYSDFARQIPPIMFEAIPRKKSKRG